MPGLRGALSHHPHPRPAGAGSSAASPAPGSRLPAAPAAPALWLGLGREAGGRRGRVAGAAAALSPCPGLRAGAAAGDPPLPIELGRGPGAEARLCPRELGVLSGGDRGVAMEPLRSSGGARAECSAAPGDAARNASRIKVEPNVRRSPVLGNGGARLRPPPRGGGQGGSAGGGAGARSAPSGCRGCPRCGEAAVPGEGLLQPGRGLRASGGHRPPPRGLHFKIRDYRDHEQSGLRAECGCSAAPLLPLAHLSSPRINADGNKIWTFWKRFSFILCACHSDMALML